MGYSESSRNDFIDDFWDKADSIPGGYIIQREIIKAVSGEDFFYNDGDTGKPVYVAGISWYDFLYYYKIWENCKEFGLPDGQGWIYQQKWLLEFIKIFNNTFKAVQNFTELKQAEAMRSKVKRR